MWENINQQITNYKPEHSDCCGEHNHRHGHHCNHDHYILEQQYNDMFNRLLFLERKVHEIIDEKNEEVIQKCVPVEKQELIQLAQIIFKS